MAKSIGETVKKRVRKGAEALGRKKAPDGPAKAKLVGVAVAGVAGMAGIVAAVQHLRKGSNGTATLHVRTRGDEWILAADGREEPLEAFRTKEEAVDAARKAAAEAAPSELVIHRLDGSVMKTHHYEPA